MGIEQVYYWFATIAMILAIFFLIGMVILVFYVKKKVSDLEKYIKYVIHKTDHVVDEVNNQVNFIARIRDTFMGKSSK
jgi:hypothetical protein